MVDFKLGGNKSWLAVRHSVTLNTGGGDGGLRGTCSCAIAPRYDVPKQVQGPWNLEVLCCCEWLVSLANIEL